MLVEMELSRIIISEINDQQVVYLREINGDRSFPILIGIFEATSINRRLTAPPPPRPLTHDLLKSVITEVGAELTDIVITSMVDHTYYAVLRVRTPAGEMIEVDSRPSDAIALAVHYDPVLPIFVDDSVLESVA
ncbi:MAG: bifunctional nuclease family protein [Planctomycetota bacterium]|nr:bifunctional nuclease family protein [Planctomycetota bacterium]